MEHEKPDRADLVTYRARRLADATLAYLSAEHRVDLERAKAPKPFKWFAAEHRVTVAVHKMLVAREKVQRCVTDLREVV